MKKYLLVLAVFALVLASIACGLSPSETQIQEAIWATQTAAPTATVTPTEIPPTEVPSATPVPVILGIDEPVKLDSGGSFLFEAANVQSSAVIGENILEPSPGYEVLVLTGRYAGNYDGYMQEAMVLEYSLYITVAGSDVRYEWSTATFEVEAFLFVFGFVVPVGGGPYTVNNVVGTPWSVELSSITN